MPRSPLVLIVLAFLWSALPLGAAAAERPVAEAPDQLTAEEDNADAQSKAACQDVRSEAGSIVIRRLVDGPRLDDGSLAFRSGVCIYLPPGYEDGGLRYPVLYLLHGGFGWQEDWFVQGDAQRVFDELHAEDPANAVIVVTPDGTSGGVWQDHPSGFPLNETYLFDHVVAYVDTYLRTIPDRRGRAIAGLSNGGAGTLRLAALRPDRFAAASAQSAALPLNMAVDRTDVRAVANDPTEMADNLELVDLHMIYGFTCGGADDPGACATFAPAYGFEHVCCNTELYKLRLDLVRDRPYAYKRVPGGHDWHYWTTWLRHDDGPFLLDALADPLPAQAELPALEPPATFDHRTIEPTVDVYGYTLITDPDRAPEFLTLRQVRADGMTLRGSGRLTVTTAQRYEPGATFVVSGADDGPVTQVLADAQGRLTFAVDLGPAHVHAEGTPQQVAAELAAGGRYWVTRDVVITPAG
jgi:enterochelin esterase-like enzyme